MPKRFCTRCGREVTGAFCTACGNRVDNPQPSYGPQQPYRQGPPQQPVRPQQQQGRPQQQQGRPPQQPVRPPQQQPVRPPQQGGLPQQQGRPPQPLGQQPFEANQAGPIVPNRFREKKNITTYVGVGLSLFNSLLVIILTIVFLIYLKDETSRSSFGLVNISSVPAILFIVMHVGLAGAGAVMVFMHKKTLFPVLFTAGQFVLAIIAGICCGVSYGKMDSIDILGNFSSIAGAYVGSAAYLISSLVGCLFWIAALVLFIVGAAQETKQRNIAKFR